MIRNVIFDFGAVLFHWDPHQIVASFTDSIDEQNLLLEDVFHHPDWLSLDRGTMLMAEVIPKFAARTGLTVSRMEDFFEHVLNSLVKIDETEELLYRLLDHHYSIYYLTNMSSAFFETLNERNNFISLFKGGVVSGKELMMKPDPEIFKLIIERYDLVPSDTLFIDVHEQNVNAAQALGFHTVQFELSASCFHLINKILDIN
ncbi:HAD family hydrolase [Photobacterium chitinilyticum]|uniref:HAD family phosphatase n=1 Tax=Photobacterium chitinilyticum TaxID=2485123 RepID=A0A444JPT8_9GAMM|nr:HAD family phosphatase [Photobacterium chitinilyticum]RWX54988.1 HAD family phosphatase [Photobacterium chitinilyticum]